MHSIEKIPGKRFFEGRTLVLATKHHKELVIAPLLESRLGVKCLVPGGIDTDLLGTFTGEVNRLDDPLTTLRKKCLMAIEITGANLVVATEGSFGPHPEIFFAPANDELVMLMDKVNGLEIVERELSMDTNFAGAYINSLDELHNFAGTVKFPSHAVILKRGKDDASEVIKGIASRNDLEASYMGLTGGNGRLYVETDMRAMFNPTRMKVIEKATLKLLDKINTLCPLCATPGFSVVETIMGLPCASCGLPTRSVLKNVLGCQKCHYRQELLYPRGLKNEDPSNCDFCNP